MPVVPLRDVVDALEMQSEDVSAYLNRVTGEIAHVSSEKPEAVELGEPLDDWTGLDEESVSKAREVLESDDFLPLPDKHDIHEWSIMERFARSQPVSAHREALSEAVHGAGAFRFFRSTLRRLGLEKAWYAYRAAAMEEIAKDWLEAKGIGYR